MTGSPHDIFAALPLSQLWQQGDVRDYWGRWEPPAIAGVNPLDNPECFEPEWFVAPPFANRTVQAADYVQADIVIPPGSFIYGILGRNQMQITDLSLDHKWFNIPTTIGNPSILFPLPSLYPVVAPGTFRCEFWNSSSSATTNVQVLFCVAVPYGIS